MLGASFIIHLVSMTSFPLLSKPILKKQVDQRFNELEASGTDFAPSLCCAVYVWFPFCPYLPIPVLPVSNNFQFHSPHFCFVPTLYAPPSFFLPRVAPPPHQAAADGAGYGSGGSSSDEDGLDL